jgi:hypothetical protein
MLLRVVRQQKRCLTHLPGGWPAAGGIVWVCACMCACVCASVCVNGCVCMQRIMDAVKGAYAVVWMHVSLSSYNTVRCLALLASQRCLTRAV